MLTQQRKALLLKRLAIDGRIVAKDLAQELGLSDDTIRRDLRELASEGLLQRVHGGALPVALAEADLVARQQIASESKQRVGKVAAGLVRAKSVVILDGGTTTLQIVRHLPLDLECTVVTHSPTIAVALADHTRVRIVMIGGILFRHSMVNVGAAAIESMSHIRADCYFMGVTGVSMGSGLDTGVWSTGNSSTEGSRVECSSAENPGTVNSGTESSGTGSSKAGGMRAEDLSSGSSSLGELSTGDLEEAHIKRALSDRAAETIVLASEEKLNVASPYVVMPLARATGIVLDGRASRPWVKSLNNKGLDVHVA